MLVDKISTMGMVDNVQMDTNYANKIEDLTSFISKISHLLANYTLSYFD